VSFFTKHRFHLWGVGFSYANLIGLALIFYVLFS
jgi:hypothetical protein